MVYVTPPHHHHDPRHLEHVIAEMRDRGSPVLRAHYDHAFQVWYCHDGTHRLRAAKALRLTPVLVPVPWWRDRRALERARYAAVQTAHAFRSVYIGASIPTRR